MARKPTTPPVKPKLELLEPTETARAKITDRIAKGELLRSGGATISPEEHAKWRSYNFTLLKGMFSTEEMAAEYKSSTFSRYVPTYFGPGQSHAVDPRESTRKLGAEITCLKSILERLEIIPVAAEVAIQEPLSPGTTERLKDTTRAFVVHGHDDAARESVARLLERLGIGAVILHEQANRGDTLVEKLERYSDVSFAVVLLTPDDEGRARGANTPLEIRARQNVILELGVLRR